MRFTACVKIYPSRRIGQRGRRLLALLLPVLLVTGLSSCSSEGQRQASPVVDSAPVSPRTPLALVYHQPAEDWMTQALPVGNGRLAAMVFGGIDQEHIQFNEESLWEGGPGEWPDYRGGNKASAHRALPEVRALLAQGSFEAADQLAGQALSGDYLGEERSTDGYSYYAGFGAYQPFGDIRVDILNEGPVSGYRRALDLHRAEVNVSYRAGEVQHRRTLFASYPAQALVARFDNDAGAGADYRVRLSSLHDHQLTHKGGKLVLTGKLQRNGMAFEAQLLVDAGGADADVEAGALVIRGARQLTLILAAATDYRAEAPNYRGRDYRAANDQVLQRLAGQTFAELRSAHRQDYRALFERLRLDLGRTDPAVAAMPLDRRLLAYRAGGADPELEVLFFQYGRYLLISASRPGSLPANLQGKWNNRTNPAWASDYHFNINIQMIYWPAEVTGLGELQLPLIRYMDSLRVPGRVTAREVFGSKGWVVNTMNNPFGYTAPGWGFPWGYFPGGAAWLSQHAWEHYAFGQDVGYLRDVAWPIMREAAEFWLDYLQPRPDGRLVSSPSYSPEHGGISQGAAMDQQLVWDLFTNLLSACAVLENDAAFCRRVGDARARLLGPQIGHWGQLQEWAEDRDDPASTHRHVSQLFALYPGRQISPATTPKLADAARVSLAARGDGGTGWSIAWKINFWARLRDGEHAYSLLRRLMRLTDEQSIEYGESGGGVYSNLLVAHPPFQLDGNEGSTAGIAEMLLQSHTGVLELLPALPPAWPDGEISGLRARGGVTVDLRWRHGRLREAVLTASRDGQFQVRYGDRLATVTLEAGKPYRFR